MKVALMHYHLRPGGVTTVLRDQVAALRQRADCIVLTGEPPAEKLDPLLTAAVRVVPGIGYTEEGTVPPDPRSEAGALRRVMLDAWGAPADVLHVHNPTLNKNPSLPAILRRLQDQGTRLLVQIHDLAEDGRSSSFFPLREDYPRDCHYCVVNSRDRDALVNAGLRPEGVHLMWNVVRSPVDLRSRPAARAARHAPTDEPLELIYPVRGIRRKNIGEAILLAALLPGRLALTLPPRNEADLARYSAWRDYARSLDLPIRFDAGLDQPLEELMRKTHGAVSTSVNEGFGFAFLEPWTAGIPVGGRRVAHVCADFERDGVRLPLQYESLPVPLDLLDAASFRQRWKDAVSAAFRSFGKDPDASALEEAWAAMILGGAVDFGALDEQAQREVIARVCADPGARRRVESRDLETLRRGFAAPDQRLVEQNSAVIRDMYGMKRYAELLDDVYLAVRDLPVIQRVDRRVLLDSFLDPRGFRMLGQR